MTKISLFQGMIFGDYQQVTFGKYSNVEDNWTFFSGSRLLGDINFADNKTLRANVVLLSDTAKGKAYVGMPAKIQKGVYNVQNKKFI